MHIAHISQMDPETDRGGVAEFARYLSRALPELECLFNPSAGHWAMAEAQNVERLNLGILNSDTTVVADGYYGGGLAGKVKKLVVVCHGTYAGWLRDMMRNYLPGFEKSYPRLIESAKAQAKVYREADMVVSVSTAAQEELWEFYRVESEVVLLGVDTSTYMPGPIGGSPWRIVEASGNNGLKGADIIGRLRQSAFSIENLGYGYHKPDRWREFRRFVMPSRHEGGPYALLEAMASGVSVIAHRAGLLIHDVPGNCVRATNDLHHSVFARMIEDAGEVTDSELTAHEARALEWVQENASLETFADGWRRVMGVKNAQ